MSGVLIHAHLISQILSAVEDGRPLLWWWSSGVEILWIGSWSAIGAILARLVRQPHYLGIAILIALSLL
jgi:CHASE2 domain-containing sensor protein